jgi:hypothetical protein
LVRVEVQIIFKQNITIVFDSLDLHDINSGRLKTLMGRDTRATVMDTPEMIVAVYPPAPTIIQIGNRRIRINLPNDTKELGHVPIWNLAIESAALVSDESTPIAYGFNFDIGAGVDGVDANDLMIQQFVRSPEELNQKLDGVLYSMIPRFRFRREEKNYDVVLEAVDAEHIKAHLNAHFELFGNSLPTSNVLRQAYGEEYEHLTEMLPRLFEA